MYVRSARFEGSDPSSMESEITRMRSDMGSMMQAEPEAATSRLSELIRRFDVFADRKNGVVIVNMYCDSEADAREVDTILDGMSPQSSDTGHRVSHDVFEVALDQELHMRKAA